ncbi:MAG: TfoX/Sxy family protein [Pseudomonadota bacterium]|nr:TfoX/Sxy family protein [Pseudomonadota bacterium]
MSDSGFVSHCLELLSPLGGTSSRRMFGGHALYIDGLCMALIIQDTLYLKVDDTHRALFERAGCKPFTYTTKKMDIHSLGYCTAPDEAMESPAEMLPWARRALAAAVAKRAKAPPAKKKAAATKAAAGKAPAKEVAAKTAPAKKPAVKPLAKKAAVKKPAARKAAKP